jgi:hypothetical protein
MANAVEPPLYGFRLTVNSIIRVSQNLNCAETLLEFLEQESDSNFGAILTLRKLKSHDWSEYVAHRWPKPATPSSETFRAAKVKKRTHEIKSISTVCARQVQQNLYYTGFD